MRMMRMMTMISRHLQNAIPLSRKDISPLQIRQRNLSRGIERHSLLRELEFRPPRLVLTIWTKRQPESSLPSYFTHNRA